ncbi:MAG: diaminopimelate epimerase [Clostridia bacterium]|nr:diaminopimelate epimerase [Clostridia bacterium]
MKIEFTKMHGIGNDYIYINCMNGMDFDPSDLSVKMSPRRFSVGADGVVCICSSDKADAKMRMFNADGSEGAMCGNATRCIGKYLFEKGIVKKDVITLETLSGIKTLYLTVKDGKVESVSVDMGVPNFSPEAVPATRELINSPVTVDGKEWLITALSVGNPHAVTFVDDPYAVDIEKTGPKFENNELFPERVNTEFVRVDGESELTMRVWERGSGETWACGTGACAVVSAAVKLGICPENTPVTVHLRGGDLVITCGERITMNGTAQFSYEGVYEYDN